MHSCSFGQYRRSPDGSWPHVVYRRHWSSHQNYPVHEHVFGAEIEKVMDSVSKLRDETLPEVLSSALITSHDVHSRTSGSPYSNEVLHGISLEVPRYRVLW